MFLQSVYGFLLSHEFAFVWAGIATIFAVYFATTLYTERKATTHLLALDDAVIRHSEVALLLDAEISALDAAMIRNQEEQIGELRLSLMLAGELPWTDPLDDADYDDK